MPFSHIPKNADEFEQKFAWLGEDKILKEVVKVNSMWEAGKLETSEQGGSFLYYDNLGYVRSVRRGSGFFFSPTFTMRNPVRTDNITREVLERILSVSTDRGMSDCLFWEFYSYPKQLWVSALAQVDALELFRHAIVKFGDIKWEHICNDILNTFTIKWTDGGVLDLEWDWYLEYPMWVDWREANGIRRVLNGHQDVVILLYRYYLTTKNRLALDLFERGEKELRKRLDTFIIKDDGMTGYSWWQVTHKDETKKFGSYSDAYQGVHIMRTHQLYTITGDPFYKECRDKMMQIKTKNPYILLPHTMQKFGYRTKEECCPTCKLDNCDNCPEFK
jgi:hypothetical protein